MQMTRVVNVNLDHYDVYIGRAGHGQSGYFGNPFKEESRKNNIENFKKYFYDRLIRDQEFRFKVLGLKNKILGCFCKPKPCHGDVIADYLNNLKPISLAVVGSRSFNDYPLLRKTLGFYEIKEIISGGAIGADSLAKRYAQEHNINIKEIKPLWDVHKKSAGYLRNVQIVDACDEVIAFWDGTSKGTGHTIEIAQSKNKPISIVNFSTIRDDEISVL